MFKSYREILQIPGGLKFSAAGLIARFPMSIVGIAQILMVTTLYGSYDIAGKVAAASVISYAVCAPMLAKLVDRYGQSKVMIPSITVSALGLIGLLVAASLHLNPWWLIVTTMVAGGASGSLGSMVRSRWTMVVQNNAQMHTAYAMESTLDEVVYMVGPVIATVLTTSVHPLAGLILALILMLSGGYWFLSQRATEPPVTHADSSAPRTSVMAQPVMIALALVYVLAGAVFGSIDMSVVAFTDALNVKQLSGLLLGIFATGSMFAGLLYGSRTWRFPLWKLFVGGVFGLAIGTTSIAFAKTWHGMALIMLVTGFSVSPTMINVNAMVQRAVPINRLTEGLTWMSTAMSLGVSLGSASAGTAIDYGGADGGFYLVIAFAWLMVLVTLVSVPALRAASRPRKRALPKDVRLRRLGLSRVWRRRRR